MPKGYKTCGECGKEIRGPKTRVCPFCGFLFTRGAEKSDDLLGALSKALEAEKRGIKTTEDASLTIGIYIRREDKTFHVQRVTYRWITVEGFKERLNAHSFLDAKKPFEIVLGTKKVDPTLIKQTVEVFEKSCQHSWRIIGKKYGMWRLTCVNCKEIVVLSDETLKEKGITPPETNHTCQAGSMQNPRPTKCEACIEELKELCNARA